METKLMKTDGFSSIFLIECSISEYIKVVAYILVYHF